jgi:bifunctional UDP-N-acetylglucosamine pyrophosphorylase/glucosamine-1-phosphate N-acetyltransferase
MTEILSSPSFNPTGCLAVILAAGEGKRMKSALPKPLHRVAGLPMAAHCLAAARGAGAERIALVLPPQSAEFDAEPSLKGSDIARFVQQERLGTAHAVLRARQAIMEARGDVLILYGDIPLILPETLAALRRKLADGAAMAVLGFEPSDPTGYGRLCTSPEGALLAIVEEKDATPEQRAIRLCNSGLMAFRAGACLPLLDRVGNANAAGEYYLTDAVELARRNGLGVAFAMAEDAREVLGVNDRVQLAEVEAAMQHRLRVQAMRDGATLMDPASVTFSYDTRLGRDVLVEPNVMFGPGVKAGDKVTIRAFSHIEGATIAPGSTIGPFARLRPGTEIGESVRIGNFVEVKQARLEHGVKVNHLSYVGDAHVGADANIGAGTITCNYDGAAKHRTEIGAGAFIGSNSALVAPVSIGDGAYIGSASVIGGEVPPGALALTRAPLVVREGWAARRKARTAKKHAAE